MIVTGVVVGATTAFAAASLLERLVDGMRPVDPLTFAAMMRVLVAAALCARFLPARRASWVAPTSALRQA
jgi:hypothetical protein